MQQLLTLAREAIESGFENKELKIPYEIKKKFSEKGASFVTLTKNESLRGCIGTLHPHQELYKDIVENARHAAFDDYRFSPLKKEELSTVKIEVSVLSKSKKIEFTDEEDLLQKIDKKMGIILKKNGRTSTFLPQVWKNISDKKRFFEELSEKAGLNKDAWKDSDIYFYRVESIKEK